MSTGNYPKAKAALDELFASLVQKYGENIVEMYISNALAETKTVAEKLPAIPVSKEEEAKK